MPGAAADLPYYTFVLLNRSTGKVDESVARHLWRVTHVLSTTLAKPQLIDWTYRYTRDAIAGAVSTTLEIDSEHRDELLQTLMDSEALEAWLAENKLRPQDYTAERADQGHDRHEFFEALGRAALEGEDMDVALASEGLQSSDPHTYAISDWWVQTRPRVLAAESVLPNFQKGYCGSVDQVAVRNDLGDAIVVTDLKTRKGNKPCGVNHKTPQAARRCHEVWPYESDHVQTGPYLETWNLLHPDQRATKRTVLIVRADGTFCEEESTVPVDVFDSLLAAFKGMRGEV